MRIACVGGGPGGLFLSILLGRTGRHSVDVFDRDPADATYGFGVVFSRLSIARLRARAPDVIHDVLRRGVRWNGVEVRYKKASARSSGHDFGAVERRALLDVLRAHAMDVGVRIVQSYPIQSLDALVDYDVVVASDGASSTLRTQLADSFQPAFSHSGTRYVWFGVNRPFPAMTFLLTDHGDGPLAAHVYPYSDAASTFLVETTDKVWSRAGFATGGSAPAGWTDERALEYCQAAFASELDGGCLIGNASRWQVFAQVRNKQWSAQRVVLLGDAAHTAHFSVGAGTSMAMEDAAELASCLERFPRIEDAFAAYQTARQPKVESIQLAARASSQFWERLTHESHRDVGELLLRLLTRTGQTDLDLLLRADPWLPAAVCRSLSAAPDVDPPPAVPLIDSDRTGPVAVLLQPEEVQAISTYRTSALEWNAVALVVEPAKETSQALERLTACLRDLRDRIGAIPVGVHCLVRTSGRAKEITPDMTAWIVDLARQAKPDFVSVGCTGPTAVVRTLQMSLCDFLRSELNLPTIFACQSGDIRFAWTHVTASRADKIWRVEGAL